MDNTEGRKVLALGRRYGVALPFYILVSDTNHAATRACFESRAWFGLNPKQVCFFEQGMWPALDADGKIILAFFSRDSRPDQA